jgi:predicted acyl esterase
VIGQDDLAVSARYMDALSDEYEGRDQGWVTRLLDVDYQGMYYIASQRALRAAMILDGQDPSALSRTEKTVINLSPEIEKLMPALTALSMDGITIGLHAGRQDS